MTDDPAYLLFPSFCGEIRCRFFIFIFVVNDVVDVMRDATSYEMIPSNITLAANELGCNWRE